MKRYRKKYRKPTETSFTTISAIIPDFMAQMKNSATQQSPQILQYWPKIVGDKLASLTQAVSINDGVMIVIVKSTTLYSLLCQYEKSRLLGLMQKQFSKKAIRDIRFRIG